ncbi:MAG TPA: PQQ-binding-like beta-propeller repeat protein [Humisphaera sp.]|nr:PQQ-binding-like beta-propeller repeat protein [Humisphaera sp.]
MNRISCIALGLIFLSVGTLRADEWPKWLGPAGTGVATDKIATKWPAGGPAKVWSQNVGLGFSSVVGLDGKIYALAMKGDTDVLTALDADTGKIVWAESSRVNHKADQSQAQNDENHLPVPEASPTIDGDKIYTYGGGGDLICRNLADGKEVWHLNVLDETNATILGWNEASSPLVADTLVFVQGGKGGALAVAVDKTSGKVQWKADKGLGGYAAPILAGPKGAEQLIIFGGDALHGLNPKTGKSLWSYPWKTSYDVNATTPIYHDGHLFISSGYGHGCAMFELHPTGVTLVWKGKEISSKYQPCILNQGILLGNSSGRLKCLKWPTQDVLWSSNKVELGEGGSFVLDGSQLICISEKGKLSLVHLTAAGADVVGEVQLFDYDKVWSSPVIYHGKLYVKGKEELVCLDIGAK